MADMNGGVDPSRYTAPGGIPGHVGTPGFGGAILDLLKALVPHIAPQGIVQRPQVVGNAIAAQEQGNAAPPSLGSQIGQ